MSDGLRERIAELLELLRPATPSEAADAILAMPGIAVVELPKPMTDLSNVATMLAKSPNFCVGDSWACFCPDGTVEFETAQQKHYGIIPPQEARDLAAALLAAADAAEREP